MPALCPALLWGTSQSLQQHYVLLVETHITHLTDLETGSVKEVVVGHIAS